MPELISIDGSDKLLPTSKGEPKILWVDFETTGLDPQIDVPLEIGYVLTDIWGEVIPNSEDVSLIWENGDEAYGRQYKQQFTVMCNNSFLNQMHTKSGLIADIAALRQRLTENKLSSLWDNSAVETDILEELQETFGIKKGELVIAGSSIFFDKSFLQNWMPDLLEFCHYRDINVSSLLEMARGINPNVAAHAPGKRENHRPLGDLVDSISLYRYMIAEFTMPDWTAYHGDAF